MVVLGVPRQAARRRRLSLTRLLELPANLHIKASNAEPALDAIDDARADIEMAEFVRYDGASVIEPAAPGKPVSYRT
jgi:hypothetical protein